LQLTFAQWIVGKQELIEEIIIDACDSYMAHYFSSLTDEQIQFEFQESEKDLNKLISADDCPYDRLGIPVLYALRYQARRISTVAKGLIPHLEQYDRDNLYLFDLGAGTGAGQIVLGLWSAYCLEVGRKRPNIYLLNIDLSPFMLEMLCFHLWPVFTDHFDADNISFSCSVNSWYNEASIDDFKDVVKPWIICSYLFDTKETPVQLVEKFQYLIRIIQPEMILFSTPNVTRKRAFMHDISNSLTALGFTIGSTTSESYLKGYTHIVGKRAQALYELVEIKNRPTTVNWDDTSYDHITLRSTNYGMMMATQPLQQLQLYNEAVRVHREIRLNSEQLKASEPSNRPTIITGAAGCGKSLVLVSRLVEILKLNFGITGKRYLVVAFNKLMVQELAIWLEKSLPDGSIVNRAYDNENFIAINVKQDGFEAIAEFTTYDRLIFSLISENRKISNDNSAISRAIFSFGQSQPQLHQKYKDILTKEFLTDEFRLIILGKSCHNLEDYLAVHRKGRGILGPNQRTAVWRVLQMMMADMDHNITDTFEYRRYRASRDILSGSIRIAKKFDHVFVDEFQDFTSADISIISEYAKDINQITLAGDGTQSIRLGRTTELPDRVGNMNRRNIIRLKESYRIPLRVAEAIAPFSKFVVGLHEGDELTNIVAESRGSPPGARPVLVYGKDLREATLNMYDALRFYLGFYGISDVLVMQKDFLYNDMFEAIAEKLELNLRIDTILAVKGLEAECVVWNGNSTVLGTLNESIFENVFAMLTRTSGLLFILMTDTMPLANRIVLSKLEQSRLLPWNQTAAEKLQEIIDSLPLEPYYKDSGDTDD
jgi:DNA helicase II / ATP-dependent DNA helicase PcrA